MKNIIIDPCDCWEYFLENYNDLLVNDHIVADNLEDYGIEICLGVQNKLPKFDVYLDDDIIYSSFLSDEQNAQEDCEKILDGIYRDYLDDIENTLNKIVVDDKDDEDDEDDEVIADTEDYWDRLINDDSIEIQERQIDKALQEFLEVACDCFVKKAFTPNEFEDIKDHFCEYLARKYKKKVYRPMYLERNDGSEFFTEYPYENMIFDDPDNPIYK